MDKTLYSVAVLGLVSLFVVPLSSEVVTSEGEPGKDINLQEVHEDKAITRIKRKTQDGGLDSPMKYRKLKPRLVEEEEKKKSDGMKMIKRRPVKIVTSELKKPVAQRNEAVSDDIPDNANGEDEDACIDEENPTDNLNSNKKANTPLKGKPAKKENEWSIRDLKAGSRKRNINKIEGGKNEEDEEACVEDENHKDKKGTDKKTETKNRKQGQRENQNIRPKPNAKHDKKNHPADQKVVEDTNKMSNSEETTDYSNEECEDEEVPIEEPPVQDILNNKLEDVLHRSYQEKEEKKPKEPEENFANKYSGLAKRTKKTC